jgi:osmotically-inducible protein OsmY
MGSQDFNQMGNDYGRSYGMGSSTSRGRFSGQGPKGYKRSDSRIEEDVNEALSQDGDLDASELQVKVHNGEVTLSGTVSDRESKRRAEDLVERCSGVQDVRNEIRVQRASESGADAQKKSPATNTGSKQSEARSA